ncbi:PilN domain-containing protein [Pseudomaricurvus sp. HS19]|uniref:PilN domain-containing protein n=1 Tax=Pseudomaricurvus sp. HS19 TaxID=2692626 RepID=UPI001367BD4D|nr:PilN domain-containing protein [Pseudomaricurvus sp. HS19]MYM63579.1 pilus assembly protein PilN [Pseudomaricurvus sp. HS19]
MANINLLPWRDEYRAEKQKEFFTVIAVVCATAALAVYIWISIINGAIDSQNERNTMLKKEIAVLNKQVREIQKLKKRRAELLARMEVIQGLQGERPVIVRYFDELVRAVPEGVYLKSLERSGNRITITGVTESNVRVSAFMRNLDDSEWFGSPNLRSVKAAPKFGKSASEFTMHFATTKPKKDKQKKKS